MTEELRTAVKAFAAQSQPETERKQEPRQVADKSSAIA